jgi:phosphopantetheine adenylyltransferase
VGITADNMLTKKTHSEEIQKFPERFANVQNFLQLIHSTLSLNLVEITDPFGPAITDAKIQALIVSSETIAGGFKINEIRTSKNMKRLDLIVISRSDSAILSSTFLRKQRLLRQQEQS